MTSPHKARCLMVIIPHSVSELVQKGETTDRYYNPENLFEEVHLVLTESDQPNKEKIQKMVGSAKLYLHCFPAPDFKSSFGYAGFALNKWSKKIEELASRVRPQLIRCHGAHLNAYAAYRIFKKLKIPYVVSLHINPDEDLRSRLKEIKQKIIFARLRQIEKKVLINAKKVLPVYKPIVPYLESLGVRSFQVAYNVLNPSHLTPKKDYTLSRPIKIISVGRQFDSKNPIHIINALKDLPQVILTIVGNGPIHDDLINQVKHLGLASRVDFKSSMPNDELSKVLHTYDFFAIHSEYWEISKSLLEALLTGLPCIVNKRIGKPVPELEEGLVYFVENTSKGYRDAINSLIENNSAREELGRRASRLAWEKWDPKKTEKIFSEIYQQSLKC